MYSLLVIPNYRVSKTYSLLVITNRLPGLNEYVKACRHNRYVGAKMKKETEEMIALEIYQQMRGKRFEKVYIEFVWYEPNKKRDLDNIAFAKKFILDALQTTGTIPGDGWEYIYGFSDTFYIAKPSIGVSVKIREVE